MIPVILAGGGGAQIVASIKTKIPKTIFEACDCGQPFAIHC